MSIKIRLVDGRAYQLYEIEAVKVDEQLDDESEFIKFDFEEMEIRVYKRYIVSVESRW